MVAITTHFNVSHSECCISTDLFLVSPMTQENVMRLRSEMQAFLSNSQREAELEEKRRYRFLAEKHQMLYNTLLQFYSRVWPWGAELGGWRGTCRQERPRAW